LIGRFSELGGVEMLKEAQSQSTKETATEEQGKVPVTMRATVQRINRKLAADGYRRLKQSRAAVEVSRSRRG
jgi:hypothetical protein